MEIKKETLDAVVGYLVTKPYNEVFQILQLIGNDVQANQQNPEQEVND